MARIASIQAVEILDSRGWPTPFVRVTTDTGDVGEASVPSGASTGEFEALELRDGDPDRYFGKGVQKAIAAIEGPIAELLRGENVLDQRRIDTLMIKADGTDNKSFFGANAVLGVSLAVARAAAASEKKPLYRYLAPKSRYRIPVPMMNIVNGGAHANNSLDIQEFMICPVGASSFAEAVRYGSEIFHSLRKILQEKGMSTAVGDEGGFAPNWSRPEEALEEILRAIEARGYRPGEDVTLALDVAASELYDPLTKRYMEKKQGSRGKARTSEEQVEFFLGLVASYPIDSIEDGMAEQDPEGWQLLTSKLGSSIRLIGDDNFVTNEKFLREGIRKGIANGVLIKPNQIGTLTETLDCIACAKKGGYTTVVSHRSGETEDSFIADLAVAVEADRIKTGSLSRSDRTAKYNRLLCIEREMLLEDLEIW